MRKISYLVALIVIACLLCNVSKAQMRNFTGSNGRIIEAELLGFNEATQIVNIRLRDGREQNVRLDLFAAACQQWIKSGGQQQGDDPFGDADDPWGESDWEWLFDGRSLNGWEGDTNAWRVDQNEQTLVGTGRGNLFTTKQYDNFIVQLQFRCEDRANNGLMIRVDDAARQGASRGDFSQIMEVQIADDRIISGPNHNGSVFNALSGPKPYTFYDRNNHLVGGWNFMEVVADGQKITTYVNGMKVVDDTLPQDKPFSSVSNGRIGLMGMDGTTAFRYIRIKPLKAGEDWRTSKITANDAAEGFTRIFDGRTLNGWQGDQDKFRIENNMLTQFDAPGKLESVKEYRNYVMRFEFRLTREGNNGIGFRQSGGNAAKIMIRDDSSFTDDRIPFHFHGSLDLTVPARRGSLNPVGQWNTMEITANGSMIRIVTNDQIIVDTDIRNFHPPTNRADVPDFIYALIAGFQNKSGSIGIAGGNRQVDFRNIRVKELP